jgi:hypothetical protein
LRKDVPHPMRALAPVLYLRQGTFVIVLLRQEKRLRSWGSFVEGRCVWQQEKSRLLTKEERVGVPKGTFVGQEFSRDVTPFPEWPTAGAAIPPPQRSDLLFGLPVHEFELV